MHCRYIWSREKNSMGFCGNARRTVVGMTDRLTAMSVDRVEQIYSSKTSSCQIMEADTEQGRILAVEKNKRFFPLNSCYDAKKSEQRMGRTV